MSCYYRSKAANIGYLVRAETYGGETYVVDLYESKHAAKEAIAELNNAEFFSCYIDDELISIDATMSPWHFHLMSCPMRTG